MGNGQELDIPHVQSLIEQVERQVSAALADGFRHVMAHMGVEEDHPSMAVVKEEVISRVQSLLEQHTSKPIHDYGKQ